MNKVEFHLKVVVLLVQLDLLSDVLYYISCD